MPQDTHREPASAIESRLARAQMYGAATLHEAAGRIGALPGRLRPITGHHNFAGVALPVTSPAGDNLWIHRALEVARPGQVMVVGFRGEVEAGYIGEVIAHAAIARGVRALVIDAQVRDVAELEAAGLPVFARGVSINGTGKDASLPGSLTAPLRLGDTDIRAGDVLVGDRDGVVCLPADRLDDVLRSSARRRSDECDIIERLYAGQSTVELYGLPAYEGSNGIDPSKARSAVS